MSMNDYVDREAGLSVTGGDESLLREVMKTYWKNLDNEMNTIEANMGTGNEAYVIAVHGLKSTSRAIGALKLGDMAYECEMAGRNGEMDKVQSLTPPLLEYARGFKAVLDNEFSGDKESDSEGRQITDAEVPHIKQRLKDIIAALGEYDCDRAEEILDELDEYEFEGGAGDLYENMSDAFESFDYDGCRDAAEALGEIL
ncbi:MAG: Hpt domain-containing protein [Lachnospiraceae bacterium]|nr:Hpt domain-containing protein [Lachnospiraceae bacterium]